MKIFLKHLVLFSLIAAGSQWLALAANESPGKPVGGVLAPVPPPPEKFSDGIIVFPINGTFLQVEVFADNIIRISSAKDRAFFARSTPATEVRRQDKTRWKLDTRGNVAMLSTAKLQVHVDLVTGAVSFFDAGGKPILAETSPDLDARRGAGRADVPCAPAVEAERR